MIIQDILPLVVARVESKMKALAVLSNKNGSSLTNNGGYIGVTPESIDFNIKCSVTTVPDFVSMLQAAGTAKNRYPFLFFNSEKVVYSDDIVNIGEIYIATLTDPTASDKERDAVNVRPILMNLAELLKESLSVFFATDHPFNHDMVVHYNGEMQFPEYVDAIKLTNVKLRFIQNC